MKDFEEISKKAFRREELEEFSSLPEKYAYLELKELYRLYNLGKITLEQAKKRKNKIRIEYIGNTRVDEVSLNICKGYNLDIKEVEQDILEIERVETKDEIIKVLADITSKLLRTPGLDTKIFSKEYLN